MLPLVDSEPDVGCWL